MEQARRITCLDLAGIVGVATGLVGDKPRLESWDLGPVKNERPERLRVLDDFIERHFADDQPDLVFYEQPLPLVVALQLGSRPGTIEMLHGAVGVVEQACARHETPVSSWIATKARQSVLGRSRFRKGEAKSNVMAYCRFLGYQPVDDNQADALVGFLSIAAKMNPRIAHLTTPLFAAVR